MAFYHSPRIVTDGLISCWDALNIKSYPGSGATWFDLLKTNDGTITSSVWNSLGYFPFGGSADWVTLANNLLGGRTNFSISAWFKPPASFSNYGAAIATEWNTGAAPGTNNFSFYYNNGSSSSSPYYPGITIEQSTSVYSVLSTVSISSSTWSNVTGIKNGSELSIITNNGAPVTESCGSGAINASTTYPFQMAKFGSGYEAKLDLAVLCLWDKALTQEEYAQNFNALKGRFGL